MLAQHLYSYSAAYLMSGTEDHLDQAGWILDVLTAHSWDDRYGNWYKAVGPDGAGADPSKDLFMKIYATTAPAV